MPVNVELLLEFIQQYPFLYDKSQKDFKDAHRKNNAWNEIANTLDCDVNEVKTRWRTLRERFVKEYKIHEANSTSGQSQEEMLFKWEWYDSMNFLWVHIKPRKTWDSSVSVQADSEDLIEQNMLQIAVDADLEIEHPPESLASSSSINQTMTKTPARNKRPKIPTEDIDKEILNKLKELDQNKPTRPPEDGDDLFCKLLACELQKVADEKEKHKRKVQLYLVATGLKTVD